MEKRSCIGDCAVQVCSSPVRVVVIRDWVMVIGDDHVRLYPHFSIESVCGLVIEEI